MTTAEPTSAGTVLDRLHDFATRLGVHGPAVGDAECQRQQHDEGVELGPDRIRVDASRDEIEPIELDDDWQAIDLEERGIR
jgi:hypothetical protein